MADNTLQNGTPFNMGYGTSQDIMSQFTSQLNKCFGDMTTQLKAIAASVGGQKALLERLTENTRDTKDGITKFTRANNDFLRNFSRYSKTSNTFDPEKAAKQLTDEIQKQLNSTQLYKARVESERKLGKNRGVTNARIDDQSRELEAYYTKLEKLLEDVSLITTGTTFKNLKQAIDQANSLIQDKQVQLSILSGKLNAGVATSEDKQAIQTFHEELEDLESSQSARQSQITELLDEIKQKLDDSQEEASDKLRRIEDMYEFLRDIKGLTEQRFSELESISPAFTQFLEKQQKVSYNDQFNEAVNNAKSVLTSAIKSLEEKMETADEAQKEILQKQLDQAKKQMKYLKNISPMKDIWKSFLTGAGKTVFGIAANAVTGLVSSFENRYFDTWTEGFQRVYDSIETTRNSISAMLKLDQGGFEALQTDIKGEIDAMGLTGSISMVDINDAIVALASAGIKDEDILKAFAIESAKLSAAGSSVNLQNEETITNLLAQIRTEQQNGLEKQDAINSTLNMLEAAAGMEQTMRDELGQDIALVNNGIDGIINTVLNMGLAQGKNSEQLSRDLQDAIVSSSSLQGSALDPAFFSTIVKDIQNQNIANMSDAFKQVLFQYGVSAETLKTMSYGDAVDKIANLMNEIIAQNDATSLAVITDAYGMSGSLEEYLKYQRNMNNIQHKATAEQTQNAQEVLVEINESLKQGTYLSKTEQVNTEKENDDLIFNTALIAERMYEGDQVVQTQLENVKSGLKEIIQLLGAALLSSGKSLISPLFGGGTAGAGAAGGGVAGTAGAGAAGAGIYQTGSGFNVMGTLAGIGIGGYMAYSKISEEGWDAFDDAQTWSGIGVSVGSAIGGPIAGAVFGGIMGASAKIGQELVHDIGQELDPYTQAAQSLQDAAEDLQKAATQSYDAATTQLNNFQTMSTAQKRDLLNNKKLTDENGDLIDAQKLLLMDEQQVNELFAKTVMKQYEDQQKQAALDIEQASLMSTNADKSVSAVNRLRSSGKKGSLYSIDTSSLGGHGRTVLESIMTSTYGTQDISNMQNVIQQYMELNPNASKEQAIAYMLGADASDENVKYYVTFFEDIDKRKKTWEENNEKFQTKWDKAKSKSPSKDVYDVALYYSSMYKDDLTLGDLAIARDSNGSILLDESKRPYLNDGDGLYYTDLYVGRYASGLTYVPSDDYPALLHKGERVLTAKEAQVYNSVIPDIVQSATTDNYFRTSNSTTMNSQSVVGTSELKDEISDQTDSLTEVLNKILNTLESLTRSTYIRGASTGINDNLLRMNSSVSQINTT